MTGRFRSDTLAIAVVATPVMMILSPAAMSQPLLEEIVVTARKKAESLMDAPVSVNAVSGESMNELGMTNLIQLSTRMPSLILGTGAEASNIYMRGVGSGVNTGFDQSVGLTLTASTSYAARCSRNRWLTCNRSKS